MAGRTWVGGRDVTRVEVRRLVQLARAIIGTPTTLLLDEPLANLEDQVRQRLRSDIATVHVERGLTTSMVTAMNVLAVPGHDVGVGSLNV